jgi:hypothetical protein
MEKLIEALEANTAIHTKVLASLAKVGGGAAASTKTSSEGKTETAKTETKAPAKGATKKKGKTVDDVAEAFGAYLGIKDADERNERKEHVKAILANFGAKKATEIPEDNFEEALAHLQQFIDGEDPYADADGDEEDEDGALV